jgi:glucokinase
MSKNEQHAPVLTLDIGGTKIAAAVVEPGGVVTSRARGETPDSSDEGALLDAAERVARQALSGADANLRDMEAVGVSCAGIINTRSGIVVYSPNVAALRRTPLRSLLSERLGMPVRLANDATLAALGEWEYGLHRSVTDLVYVTVSTGIGGGIIARGRLLEGACGAGGEVGHMTIDVNGPACACGRSGCWEALASGSALAERTVRRLEAGENSIIGELSGGDMSNVDAQMVSLAARQGDRLAKEMIEMTAYYVGVGLGNLINIFNPSVVVVGGGVTKIGEALLGPAAEVARARAYVTAAGDVDIRTALLGDDSPLLGAAALVWGLGDS